MLVPARIATAPTPSNSLRTAAGVIADSRGSSQRSDWRCRFDPVRFRDLLSPHWCWLFSLFRIGREPTGAPRGRILDAGFFRLRHLLREPVLLALCGYSRW